MSTLLFHGKDGRSIFEQLKELVHSAKSRVLVSSAWISGDVIRELFGDLPESVEKRVIIRASEKKDLDIDKPEAIEIFKMLGFEIAFHPNVHAKFIVIDEKAAAVGSSNLTRNGLLGGNVEVNVCFEGVLAQELAEQFEGMWQEARKSSEDIVGITMNPGKTLSAEFLVIDEGKVKEQMFVLIETEEGYKYLARVNSLMVYDTSFFMNPFTTQEGMKFPSFEEFAFINYSTLKEWRIGAISAILNSKASPSFTIATASVEGKVVEENGTFRLEREFRPIPPRSWVKTLSAAGKGFFKSLIEANGGASPIKTGKIFASDQEAFIDFDEITRTHMAILGTTGSGKSFFAKCLLKRVLCQMKEEPLRIFIFDPHGEYAAELGKWAEEEGVSDLVQVVDLEGDIPVPLDAEDVKNALSRFGLFGGSEEGLFNSLMMEKTSKANEEFVKSLLDFSFEVKPGKGEKEPLAERVNRGEKIFLVKELPKLLIDELYEGFMEELLGQLEEIDEKLKASAGKLVIYNFRKISSPEVRVSIAGYIGAYLFEKAKMEGQDREEKYLIVLEEAHNFVPERSFGDVSAGKSNPAFRAFTKIASEGRKFKVSLLSITQRPANVSKYLLSQSNTLAVFRLVNESDLNTIREIAEGASKEIIRLLPSLGRGQAFIFGLATPLPALVEISCD